MMKIDFERTGGFAGLRLAVSVDVDNLPDQEAQALRKLVNDADFFNFSDAHPGKAVPDSFQYKVTIENNQQKRTVQVGDMSVPDKLRPLIDDLNQRARSQRKP
jgi:hypothetical protein